MNNYKTKRANVASQRKRQKAKKQRQDFFALHTRWLKQPLAVCPAAKQRLLFCDSKKIAFCLLLITCFGIGYSQIETMEINKETFLKPSVNSMGYLVLNTDTAKWNESLLSIGLTPVTASQKVKAYKIEFKKEVNGMSQYIGLKNIGIDGRFFVLIIIWKDESGKILITNDLKKALKKHEFNDTGYYKIDYNGQVLTIEIETDKEKMINEMITVEVEIK